MAQSKLDILLNAKNNASKHIKAVSSEITGLNKNAGLLVRSFGAFGAIATAGAFSRLALDAAQAAAQFNTLKANMDQLAVGVGQSSDRMLDSMRKASMGMISDTQLVQAANRAMMLGVADSADEMGDLLEVAIKRGAAMGLTAEQAFNDLVTGIGRMSPLILDNLGIVTGGEAVFNNYAASIGKAASALSDAEKKQALLNSVIAQSSGISLKLDEATSSTQRLTASFANLQVRLGQIFSPAVQAAAGALADAIERLEQLLTKGYEADRIANARAELDRLLALQDRIKSSIDELNSRKIKFGTAGDLANLNQSLESVEAAIVRVRAQLEQEEAARQQRILAQELHTVAAAANNAAAGAWTAGNAWASVTRIFANAAGELRNLALASSTAQLQGAAISMIGGGGDIDAALRYLDDSKHLVSQQVAEWEALGYTSSEINNVLLPGFIAQLTKIDQTTKSVAGSTAAVSSEYSKLEGIVSGIVSGAIGPVAGVDANDFLPRPDAVNENARRLADIMVNGFTGQDWLGEFQREVPDIYQALVDSGDPKNAAAQLLKDFQDGLVPSLIDKERAKELAKRALIGDQNAAKLAEEIAQELASEMNISLSKARAAAGAAVGGGSATAKKAAEAVTVVPKIDVGSVDPVRLVGKIQEIDDSFLDEIDCIPIKVCPVMQIDANTAMNWSLMIQQKWDTSQKATVNVTPQLAVDVPALQNQIALSVAMGGGLTVPATVVRGATISPTEEETALIGQQLAGDIGTGFGPAFDEQMLGQYMALSLASQVEENAALFEASGKRAAQMWGPAFLAQLEQDLPAGLVLALTAEVWDNLAYLFDSQGATTAPLGGDGANTITLPAPDSNGLRNP